MANFHRGSSQRRITSTRRASQRAKTVLEDMFGRDVRMESIASFMRQSLPVYPWEETFSVRADMSRKCPEADIVRPQINPADSKPGVDDALGRSFYYFATCAVDTTTSVRKPSQLRGRRRRSTSRSIDSALFPSTAGDDDENVRTRRARSLTLS